MLIQVDIYWFNPQPAVCFVKIGWWEISLGFGFIGVGGLLCEGGFMDGVGFEGLYGVCWWEELWDDDWSLLACGRAKN